MATINSLNNSSAPFTVTTGNLTVTAGNILLPAFNSGGTQGIITIGGTNAFTTDASSNIFIGINSGRTALSGTNNLACGGNAFQAVTSGSGNCLYGNTIMQTATTGTGNTCFGHASYNLGNGSNNLIIGGSSGTKLTTGNTNTFIGNAAGFNSGGGTGVTTGSNNILIGYTVASAYTGAESNNIIISNGSAVIGDSNTIRIGFSSTPSSKAFIDGVFGTTVAISGIAVLVDANGQLGTIASSIRFKENINKIGSISNDIYNLNPVSFNYKKDVTKATHYGLIAEEVNEVMPELVVHDDQGEINTVRYDQLVPLLLNEVQQLRKELNELKGQYGKNNK